MIYENRLINISQRYNMAQLKISDLVTPIDLNANSLSEEWKRFKSQINCLFEINEINSKNDKIKISYLTLLIGNDAADLFDHLGLSEEDKNCFEKLIDGYENCFRLKTSIYVNRMKFYQAFQDDTETFVQFVSRVRKLA
ncbi:unnamed protein product [Chironomus riparius]|uniref:Uncharacterized protein n=1 Tax=Chironomus riparius TaxID=315576 RepID=A0A9N9RR37_9DIPT|nr:unnamed protein product [Chironomus riparius]